MAEAEKHPGKLIVLVGPSGVGKSTLSRLLASKMQINYTVSMTTREKRPGDDGKKIYQYIDLKDFFRRLDQDEFLEYAQVHGNYYATPKHPALDQLAAGEDVLLEIDVQGALQVRYQYPQALLIFIEPPSMQTLLDRLDGRGRDSAEEIAQRFRAARREIHMARGSRAFDRTVINDDLDRAAGELVKIIQQSRTGNL